MSVPALHHIEDWYPMQIMPNPRTTCRMLRTRMCGDGTGCGRADPCHKTLNNAMHFRFVSLLASKLRRVQSLAQARCRPKTTALHHL